MEIEDEEGSTMALLTQDDTFIWDEPSQLYHHARSGFYHDPNAGWYYSSTDGFYYTYENGSYVLLESNKDSQSETCEHGEFGGNDEGNQEDHGAEEHIHDGGHCTLIEDNDTSNQIVSVSDGQASDIPPPTSDWLEETLINMYLSGYKNLEPVDASEDMSFERDEIGNTDDHTQEEGKEEEELSWEEQNWLAQYGQEIHSEEETTFDNSTVDMWDWVMTREPEKEGYHPVARLVGRLVHPSTKLHPSMPLGGKRLRTAPICEARLDLVRVKSGQIYKLQSPSAGYLTTLSCYDSSNPTKFWGFPELSVVYKSNPSKKTQQNTESMANLHISQSGKQENHAYRDRAAERRALHGGFGIGPGQKKTDDGSLPSSPPSTSEEAASEALEMSFGADSYAQKILKNMGWKEGEALGISKQGLTEPLVAVGNKGSAGLGWYHGLTRHP